MCALWIYVLLLISIQSMHHVYLVEGAQSKVSGYIDIYPAMSRVSFSLSHVFDLAAAFSLPPP
jgi:hypothetical protein